MDNKSFLEKLKFSVSDQSVHYYLYNWMCPNMSPDKVFSALMLQSVKSYYCHSLHLHAMVHHFIV